MNTYFNSGAVDGIGAERAPLLRLHQIKAGKEVRIRELAATPELTCRLREIGMCEGSTIKLIACNSNIICLVCNARLALNAALAQMILVEPIAD